MSGTKSASTTLAEIEARELMLKGAKLERERIRNAIEGMLYSERTIKAFDGGSRERTLKDVLALLKGGNA